VPEERYRGDNGAARGGLRAGSIGVSFSKAVRNKGCRSRPRRSTHCFPGGGRRTACGTRRSTTYLTPEPRRRRNEREPIRAVVPGHDLRREPRRRDGCDRLGMPCGARTRRVRCPGRTRPAEAGPVDDHYFQGRARRGRDQLRDPGRLHHGDTDRDGYREQGRPLGEVRAVRDRAAAQPRRLHLLREVRNPTLGGRRPRRRSWNTKASR
jgi:hypothetical protein